MVLGRRAQQRRAADVDVLDRRRQVAIGRATVCSNGIEVDHDQVDGLDLVLAHHVRRRCRAAPRMPPWMRGCSVLTRPAIISGKPV
jgi:hypothetical protein